MEANKKLRFINFLIDLVIIYLLSIFIQYLFKLDSLNNTMLLILNTIVLKWLYYLLMEGFTGRTIGKIITRTKVVNKNEVKPSFPFIFKRTLFRLIPLEIFSFLGKG